MWLDGSGGGRPNEPFIQTRRVVIVREVDGTFSIGRDGTGVYMGKGGKMDGERGGGIK